MGDEETHLFSILKNATIIKITVAHVAIMWRICIGVITACMDMKAFIMTDWMTLVPTTNDGSKVVAHKFW